MAGDSRGERGGPCLEPTEAMTDLRATIIDAEGALQLGPEWDRLAAHSLEPNVFLSQWMGQARLRHLPDAGRARVVVVRDGPSDASLLVGVSIVTKPRGLYATPLPVLRAADLYAPLSTPLFAPEAAERGWGAMLRALAEAGIVGVAFPFLTAGGPVAHALRRAVEDPSQVAVLEAHSRAFLDTPLGSNAYLSATLGRKRIKELERHKRRLSEHDPLRLEIVSAEPDVTAALDEFLSLEKRGWKGRAGTDLATSPGAAAYFRAAAAAGSATHAFRVASLRLGDRVIAGGLLGIANGRAFYIKTAYDEALAKYSPGRLLTLAITESLLDDPAIRDADSIADADHPMIDRLWTGRLPIENVFVATAPESRLAEAALRVERLRLSMRRSLRAARGRWRRTA
jgi:CelD/BcsL family acetyltransferase involved in cellulose biosynthesis